MKLKNVLVGQSVRFIRLLEPLGGIYIPDFIKAMQDEYKFVTIPKTLAEFDRTKGIRFEHGLFKKEDKNIVLDRLQIYDNGIVIETRAYAEEADLFLNDMISWAIRVLGIRHDSDTRVARAYLSNIEVEMKNPFPAARSKVTDAISKMLSKRLSEYGIKAEPYEEVGFTMYVDTLDLKAPFPTNFKLERREGFGFGSNVFFSSAPLKTEDHLDLLEHVESSL
jgi:hypothetical protein